MIAGDPAPPQERDDRPDPRPVVRLPRAGVPGLVIAISIGIAALLLFLLLDANRRHRGMAAQTASGGAEITSPPPLVVPPETPPMIEMPVNRTPPAPLVIRQAQPMPSISLALVPPQPAPASPPTIVASQDGSSVGRSDGAALVYDGGGSSSTLPSSAGATGGAAASTGGASDGAATRTTSIGSRATTMAMGTVIPAVLETPIDSTRPGLARAVVAEDARGFDGTRVLIPRGSRLIGDYASDVRSGQKRVLVTWTRLIRPDGTAIRVDSPAADALGGAGVPGKLNSFFLRRFTGALLQSALAVGVNLASRPGNGSVIVGLPNASTGVIGQDLTPTDIRPRIRVKQGAVLDIFVAHDLDFAGAPPVDRAR